MTISKRYIAGTLASGDYPQHLASTKVPPTVASWDKTPWQDGKPRADFWRTLDERGRPKGRIENLSFPVTRGRVSEFRSGYGGQVCVGRETDDQALVQQIDMARERVTAAREAYSRAVADEQEVLAACVPRMKPAKITNPNDDTNEKGTDHDHD